MKKYKKLAIALLLVLMVTMLFSTTAFAATGDVAGAIEGTWNDASGQIKTVVNKVVFPAIDLILAVFFFAKLGTAYFDFRKHGQFEWSAPAILFACLVFTLTAPTYIWSILGIWWKEQAESFRQDSACFTNGNLSITKLKVNVLYLISLLFYKINQIFCF